jgi:hypothetical protein
LNGKTINDNCCWFFFVFFDILRFAAHWIIVDDDRVEALNPKLFRLIQHD